jgi:hypothetical protein
MAPQDNSRWKSRPGSFDSLHTSLIFLSDNLLGIPSLLHTPTTAIPKWLVPYRTRIRTTRDDLSDGAVHFFLDDYRFETVWRRPRKALEALAPYSTLLTPDFSLYRDWPHAAQIWNTYRARWCGRFWQSLGYWIIPTLAWSTPDSFDFCFLGVPRNSLVAVSGVGVDFSIPIQSQAFTEGFAEMARRLTPTTVLSYGELPTELHELVEIITYPTRWEGIQAARERGRVAYGR